MHMCVYVCTHKLCAHTHTRDLLLLLLLQILFVIAIIIINLVWCREHKWVITLQSYCLLRYNNKFWFNSKMIIFSHYYGIRRKQFHRFELGNIFFILLFWISLEHYTYKGNLNINYTYLKIPPIHYGLRIFILISSSEFIPYWNSFAVIKNGYKMNDILYFHYNKNKHE